LHFFDYEVHPLADEAGTYFYHSHVGFQAGSCAGPLIVQDAGPPPYRYDDERVVFLGDYFNKTDQAIVAGLLANPFVWSGEANSLLVNGQTGTSTNGGSSCAPAVFTVEPEKIYRFRFIGGTALSFITLAFEGHSDLSIIEADGEYTQPFSIPYLQVGSGERFSILLKTKSVAQLEADRKTTYWIQLENRERPSSVRSYAILSYKTSTSGGPPPSLPSQPPLTVLEQMFDFLGYSLLPLHPDNSFPTLSQVTRRVTITVQQLINGTIKWEENMDSWIPEKILVPYLVAIYEKGQAGIPDYQAAINNHGWDPNTFAFPAKIGEVLEIVWQSDNGPSGAWDVHPLHAHGGHYWDIGSGNGTYDAEANEKRLQGYTPVKRDTTMLYRYATKGVPYTTAGWRAWRLKVQYPGVWMIHCHTLQHMIMAMTLLCHHHSWPVYSC
jgi:L-ascorbate oxidase